MSQNQTIIAVSNHWRTPLFFAGLQEAGLAADTVWLCVSHSWRQWLLDQGVPAERTHLLLEAQEGAARRGGDGGGGDPAARLAASLEEHGVERKLVVRRMVLADRILREKPFDHAAAYLDSVAQTMFSLLRDYSVSAVLLEPTWAHELLIAGIAEAAGIPVGAPSSIRFPTGRYTLFEGIDHLKIAVPPGPVDSETQATAADFLNQFRSRASRPCYFARNDNYFPVEPAWITKFIRKLRRDLARDGEQTRLSALALAKTRVTEHVRRRLLRRTLGTLTPAVSELRPYLFFPLHVQPEASIDVLGDRYNNQYEVLKAICSTAPLGCRIVVKEHSNFLGSKPLSFYRRLAQLPGVMLVSPYLDSRELIANAELTMSITGTAAYEAALLGRPAVTLKPMFFSPLLLRQSWSPFSETVTDLLEEAETFSNDADVLPFLEQLISRSFSGSVSDTRSDAAVLDRENICGVGKALRTWYEHCTAAAAASKGWQA